MAFVEGDGRSDRPVLRRPVARPAMNTHPRLIRRREHGTFTDSIDTFSVRSTTSDPEILRVHAPELPVCDFWVVVLTDVGTSRVNTEWCGKWAAYSPEWKRIFIDHVFRAYYECKPRPLPVAWSSPAGTGAR